MTAQQFLQTIWRRKLYVVVTVVVATLGAFFAGRALPEVYSSSATIFIGNGDRKQNSFEALQSEQLLAKTYGELIQSRNVAALVAAELAGRLTATGGEGPSEPYLLAQTGTGDASDDAGGQAPAGRGDQQRGGTRETNEQAPARGGGQQRGNGGQANGGSGGARPAAQARPEPVPVPRPQVPGALDPQDVLERMSFQPVVDTQLIIITAEGPTGAEAALLANTYGRVFEQYASSYLAERTQGDVSMVDAARIPAAPDRPQPKLYAAVAFGLALFLGAGLAILRERIGTRLGDEEELSDALSLPILARVPMFSQRRRGRPEQQRFIEAFRVLRTNLQFLGGGKELTRLAVTSGSAEEGKSTSVVALAHAVAEQGRTVLIIEGDLRRPALAERLGVDPLARGLAHRLALTMEIDEVIHETDLPNVMLMPAGAVPPTPASLLKPTVIEDLVAEIAPSFDVVLIDSPPLAAGADASILANAAEAVLLVVNRRRSTAGRANRTVKALRQSGAHLVGLVINEVPSERRAAYDGYYGDPGVTQEVALDGERQQLSSAG